MDIDIEKIKNVEALKIHEHKIQEVTGIEALRIGEVQDISPVAAHIKEVNHIDPLSIDALHVSEVKNVEPLSVEKFDVTNLPMVNMSVRQLPSVDLNIRRLPPVSIGTHQTFHMPSNYTVRARFLGIEFLRMNMCGQTTVIPGERYRREQAKTPNRSYPLVATAGNPGIPSILRERSATGSRPVPVGYARPTYHMGPGHYTGLGATPAPLGSQPTAYSGSSPATYGHEGGSLHCGPPAASFRMADSGSRAVYGGSSASSGG